MKRKELNPRQKKTDRNNLILLTLCCAYLALMTGLFIPSAVISASPAEFVDAHYFRDPARYLVSSSLLGAGIFLAAGTAIGLVLPPKGRKRYTTVLAAVTAAAASLYWDRTARRSPLRSTETGELICAVSTAFR